ncbi:glycosyltransferase [Nafulsella turpanensis]|uniref:glycosyltransferase n=1 Tax=Nafulsella turpanensis TaxID=1265690 RepID=UPI000360033C|nr:glycosyltransferase [Nafulsella turpanensis]
MKVSVIICTLNREEFIIDALESLYKQDFPKEDFEVIVVDNNSTDRTPDLVLSFIQRHPEMNLKLVYERRQGLSFARNKGIDDSTADIVTFIDDDAIAIPQFVKEVNKMFHEYPEADAVGGKIIPVYNKTQNPPPWMTDYISGIVSAVDLGERVKVFDKKYPAGCNMSFRKGVLNRVNRFNTNLTQRSDDKEVFIKLRKIKAKVMYTPYAVVYHQIPASRMTKQGVIQVSKVTGQGERARLIHSSLNAKAVKLIEYLFKQAAAFALGAIFILKGESSKAYYLILVRWYILKGFFLK